MWTAEYAISLLLVVVAALYWSAQPGGAMGSASREDDVLKPIRNEVDVRVRDYDDRIERELKISRLRVGTLLDAEFEDADRKRWIQETMANHDHLLQTLAYRVRPRLLVGPLPAKPLGNPSSHSNGAGSSVPKDPLSVETMVLFPIDENRADVPREAAVSMDKVAGFHPEILGDQSQKFWLLHANPGVWIVRVIYLIEDAKSSPNNKTWVLEDWRLDRLLRLELLSGRKSLVSVEGFVLTDRDISRAARRAVASTGGRLSNGTRSEFKSKSSVGAFKRMAHLPMYFLFESADLDSGANTPSGQRLYLDVLPGVFLLIVFFTVVFYLRWSRPMTVLLEALERMLEGRHVGTILRRSPKGGVRAWWVHSSIQQVALHLEAVAFRLRSAPKTAGDSVEARLRMTSRSVLESKWTPPAPKSSSDFDASLDSKSEIATLMAPLVDTSYAKPSRPEEILVEPSSDVIQASEKKKLHFPLRIKVSANAQFPMETTFPGRAALEQIIGWVASGEGVVLWRAEDECVLGYSSPDIAIRMALEIRSKLRDIRFEQNVNWSVAMCVDVDSEKNDDSSISGSDTHDRGRRLIKLVKKIDSDLLVTQDALRESHLTYLIDQGSGYKVKSQGRTMNVIKIHGYINQDGERVTVRAPETASEATGTTTLRPINRENILWLDEQSRLAGKMNGAFADFGEIERNGGGTGVIESNQASKPEIPLGSQSIASMSGASTDVFEKSPARVAFEQALADRKRGA